MALSEEELGFDAQVDQEESFLLMDEFLPPEAEEQLCVEFMDTLAIATPPANTIPAESETESATDVQLQSSVLPQKEADAVSSSPCVRRVKLRSKTTVPPDSPFNVNPKPVSAEGKKPGEPSEKGNLTWWLEVDERSQE